MQADLEHCIVLLLSEQKQIKPIKEKDVIFLN